MNSGNIVLHDFTGVYRQMPELLSVSTVCHDHRELRGVHGYVDPEAGEELQRLMQYPGIHFLDSGNYHALSYLYAGLIRKPYQLVVYDHHTDMMFPAFGRILSCGSWIGDLLLDDPFLQQVFLIGADAELIRETREQWRGTDAEKELDRVVFADSVRDCTFSLPVYLSVDKDVVRKEDFSSDWDQGEMQAETLLQEIRSLQEKAALLGVDVCGEPVPADADGIRRSEWLNLEIVRILSGNI